MKSARLNPVLAILMTASSSLVMRAIPDGRRAIRKWNGWRRDAWSPCADDGDQHFNRNPACPSRDRHWILDAEAEPLDENNVPSGMDQTASMGRSSERSTSMVGGAEGGQSSIAAPGGADSIGGFHELGFIGGETTSANEVDLTGGIRSPHAAGGDDSSITGEVQMGGRQGDFPGVSGGIEQEPSLVCGNGLVELDEARDDGNETSGRMRCQLSTDRSATASSLKASNVMTVTEITVTPA